MNREYSVVQTGDLGNNVQIAEFCVIRPGVVIGNDVTIHPNVVIESGVVIGDGVEIFPGAYLGKKPKPAGNVSRPINYALEIIIGSGCVVGPYSIIYYDVRIGDNTLIGDAVSIRELCRIGTRCVLGRHITINYSTIIGNGVKIMDHAWLAGNMTVEDGAFISGGVMTANDNSIGVSHYSEQMIGPHIGPGAKIGVGSILLPGIMIGGGATIAAGSVVTKDVDVGDLVMGMPAKPAKKQ